MRELLERESADPKRYELVVAHGNPLQTIMRAIGTRQPDLLVYGNERRWADAASRAWQRCQSAFEGGAL